MENKASAKLEWIKKRLIEICLGIENIAMWDNIQSDFLDRVHEYSKRFPCTNIGAFIKILSQNSSLKPKIEVLVSENDTQMVSPKNDQKPLLFKRRSHSIANKTIELSPNDYTRPKSSVNVYHGGMFCAPTDFSLRVEQ